MRLSSLKKSWAEIMRRTAALPTERNTDKEGITVQLMLQEEILYIETINSKPYVKKDIHKFTAIQWVNIVMDSVFGFK